MFRPRIFRTVWVESFSNCFHRSFRFSEPKATCKKLPTSTTPCTWGLASTWPRKTNSRKAARKHYAKSTAAVGIESRTFILLFIIFDWNQCRAKKSWVLSADLIEHGLSRLHQKKDIVYETKRVISLSLSVCSWSTENCASLARSQGVLPDCSDNPLTCNLCSCFSWLLGPPLIYNYM